jgi:hypothetical protein
MRRALTLASQNVLSLDGLAAECWFVNLNSDVNTVLLANLTPGMTYTVTLRQDSAGNHVFVWPMNSLGAVAVNPTANSLTVQNFIATMQHQLAASQPGTWT